MSEQAVWIEALADVETVRLANLFAAWKMHDSVSQKTFSYFKLLFCRQT